MRSLVATALASTFLAGPACAADPLKIGVLMPTSGVFAVLGERQLNGMKYAISEFNGEVAGRKIEMITEDTEGKPDVGLAKTRKLVLSDKVDVTAGIINSAVALAVQPYLSQQKIPLVISNASTDQLTGEKCDPYFFRVSFSTAQVTEPVGQWMAKNAPKNVYVLFSDYVAPYEYVAAFEKGYVQGGGQVVGKTATPFGRTQDYGPYISQARASNPGAVYAVYFAAEAVTFVKQYESFGMKAATPLYGPMGLTPPVLRGAQGTAATGSITGSNYVQEIDTPENRKFREGYKKMFNVDPEEFAVAAYDSMRFILEAVKARNGDTKDRPALVSALEKVAYDGPRGPISMGRNHQITQNIYVVKAVERGGQPGFEILETYKNVTDPVPGCKM